MMNFSMELASSRPNFVDLFALVDPITGNCGIQTQCSLRIAKTCDVVKIRAHFYNPHPFALENGHIILWLPKSVTLIGINFDTDVNIDSHWKMSTTPQPHRMDSIHSFLHKTNINLRRYLSVKVGRVELKREMTVDLLLTVEPSEPIQSLHMKGYTIPSSFCHPYKSPTRRSQDPDILLPIPIHIIAQPDLDRRFHLATEDEHRITHSTYSSFMEFPISITPTSSSSSQESSVTMTQIASIDDDSDKSPKNSMVLSLILDELQLKPSIHVVVFLIDATMYNRPAASNGVVKNMQTAYKNIISTRLFEAISFMSKLGSGDEEKGNIENSAKRIAVSVIQQTKDAQSVILPPTYIDDAALLNDLNVHLKSKLLFDSSCRHCDITFGSLLARQTIYDFCAGSVNSVGSIIVLSHSDCSLKGLGTFSASARESIVPTHLLQSMIDRSSDHIETSPLIQLNVVSIDSEVVHPESDETQEITVGDRIVDLIQATGGDHLYCYSHVNDDGRKESDLKDGLFLLVENALRLDGLILAPSININNNGRIVAEESLAPYHMLPIYHDVSVDRPCLKSSILTCARQGDMQGPIRITLTGTMCGKQVMVSVGVVNVQFSQFQSELVTAEDFRRLVLYRNKIRLLERGLAFLDCGDVDAPTVIRQASDAMRSDIIATSEAGNVPSALTSIEMDEITPVSSIWMARPTDGDNEPKMKFPTNGDMFGGRRSSQQNYRGHGRLWRRITKLWACCMLSMPSPVRFILLVVGAIIAFPFLLVYRCFSCCVRSTVELHRVYYGTVKILDMLEDGGQTTSPLHN